MRLFFFALLLSFSLSPHSRAAEEIPVQEAPELEAHFREQGVTGTFVLLDVKAKVRRVFNRSRAEQRFIPASTFKIPNTLIGLSTGAVKNVDEVLPYGGKPQWLPEWEKDLSLRDAIRVSSVPVYQELARRIGQERMAEAVRKLHYGNAETGSVVDRFWLDGPLQISAVEQTDFLAALAQGRVPFPAEAVRAVQEITLLERTPRGVLHGKTGWTGSSAKPAAGWLAGWVEARDGAVFSFALNIEMTVMAEAPKRMLLVRACLKTLKVLD